ncbi:MAG TPA: hypothetical protein VG389_04075 [Myxococcota bacterium]|jgi:hypothetical protein|nr:hypothetical protein [Myxococcota bacterium]
MQVFGFKWLSAGLLVLGLSAASAAAMAATAPAAPAAGKVVFKSDKVIKVTKDGGGVEFKTESGAKYDVEFMESKMAKECEVKAGSAEAWTTKSDKAWTKVTLEVTADSASTKLQFTTTAKEGACDAYQVKAIKVTKK